MQTTAAGLMGQEGDGTGGGIPGAMTSPTFDATSAKWDTTSLYITLDKNIRNTMNWKLYANYRPQPLYIRNFETMLFLNLSSL